jgi:hypothetical protein
VEMINGHWHIMSGCHHATPAHMLASHHIHGTSQVAETAAWPGKPGSRMAGVAGRPGGWGGRWRPGG